MHDFPHAANQPAELSVDGSAEKVILGREREILRRDLSVPSLQHGRRFAAAAGARVVRQSAIACLAMFALTAVAVQAQVVESFDYSPGGLGRRDGGTGWSGPWHIQSSENGGDWVVDKQGLDHPALDGAAGFAALSPVHGSRYQRNFAEPFKSGVVYLSFLTKSSNRSADPYSAVELQLKGNGEAFRIFQLGLLRNDDGNPNGGDESAFYARSRASVGGGGGDTVYLAKFNTAVNLFVVRFDLDARLATVFVNPDGGVDLTGSGDGALTLFPKFSFDRVCIANFAGENEYVVDELRIADTPPRLSSSKETERMIDRDGEDDRDSL